MRVLFAIAVPTVMEPMGVALLSAICKQAGHETALTILKNEDLCARVKEVNPDVVAYSVIGGEIDIVKAADTRLLQYLKTSGKKIYRIMGGPLPTYFPGVIDEMGLDAICQGDGDHALPNLLSAFASGGSISAIPNIAVTSAGAQKREQLTGAELDALPFADRGLYFRTVPFVQPTGLRSFMTSRGCPYSCAYCYNNAYNRMFQGLGPAVRRGSVERSLAEIEYNIREFPPVKFIRFFDHVFCVHIDDWLEEFAEKYPARIGIPFYCLINPRAFTEDMARLLAQAGCFSVSMSLETGIESVRKDVLGRRLSNDEVTEIWRLARKYKLRTFGNTMVGIPGTTLKDDYFSLEFTRNLRCSVPTFTVCSPSRGTRLADIAQEKGLFEKDADLVTRATIRSPLNCYTEREKEIQTRMAYFGTLYCVVPAFLAPIVRAFITYRLLPKAVAYRVGVAFQVLFVALRILPRAIPKSPLTIIRLAINGIRYMR